MIAGEEKKLGLFGRIGRLFSYNNTGYAAVQDSNNRQSITKNLSTVDKDLKGKDRDKAITRARDHQKNFSIAGWMARKHLDFIAEQSLAIKTGDKELDKDVEAAISERSEPKNFDYRGFHSRESFTRIMEASGVVDGDIFAQKLRTFHIQGIEGDRVRTPSKVDDPKEWNHGCRTDRGGKVRQIAVCRRGDSKNSFELEAVLPYERVFHHGNFQRLDQVRGVSPLLAAMNDLQDVYENKAYGLAKAKVGQFFGLALFRSSNDGEGDTPDPTKGAMVLEMAKDDEAKFLNDRNPSNEWKAFMEMVISMALKSLDIPFSFYQENFTNFFGSKSALILYLKSCVAKRRNLRERWLNPWTQWQLNGLKMRNEFRSLRALDAIPFRWIALGTPWANPLQEVQASIMEIGMGMTSRKRKVMEIYGEDVYDIIDEIKDEEDYMRKQGVEVKGPSTLITGEMSNEA